MCIICVSRSGVRQPTISSIHSMFKHNPHGAGFMYARDGRVHISKGYMNVDEYVEAVERAAFTAADSVVYHFRISTQAGVGPAMTHPFPLSNQLEHMKALEVTCPCGVAHNGVISGMHTNAKLGISDTVTFVSDVIARMWRRDNKVTKKMKRRIAAAAPNNRFAILTKSGNVYRIGDGWESVSPGIEASNSSWRYSRLSYVDELDWADVKYDYYRDSGYSASYRDVFDFWCKDCPNCATCLAYGACCDDIADYIDELDRDDKAHSYSEDDDDWYGYLYDGVGYNLASQDIPF